MDPTPGIEATGLTGRTLGDFVVREAIGSGGFGTIYRAEQPLLAREVVVKVLRSGNQADEATVQRFLREARLASRLDHPYAAHVYAFGAEPGGLLWIAMEWVRGTSLQEVLRARGALPLAQLVPFLERVCEVVHSAHEQGIVHRDLKPANIMVLSRAGRMLPKLLDFGIAKLEGAPLAAGDGAPPAASPPVAFDVERWSDLTLDEQLGKAESVQLTQQGNFIGSPQYMAPEQWLDPASAGPRCDLYALGILTYQLLTGAVPFEGSSLRAIARHHARSPLPPLPAGVPPKVHEVLARAAAKSPEDRFPDALALAQALRQASGLGEAVDELPQLDEAIRQEMVAGAPQPLADAVTALEAARSAEEALGALTAVARVALRYLGTLALACRARVGPGTAAESDAAVESLRALRWQGLDDEGWLRLCRELVRPFATTREAYPIPELVTLFLEPNGDVASPASRALERFASEWPRQVREAQPSGAVALLSDGLARLERMLSSLAFTFDYPLAVERGGAPELWMGARREHRARAKVEDGPLPPGAVALLSREGHSVLMLSPLVQALAPTPGAAEELFFLAGNGRHGARLASPARGFERSDPDVWEWFRSSIRDLGESGGANEQREVAPFRGLSSFTADDADRFFGREREAEAFANRLRVQRLLAVVGPSGSGKSSFVQAGVVPLFRDWRTVTVRPGATPLAALRARLASAHLEVPEPERLASDPEALRHALAGALPAGQTLLLVIDQFEELLTLCQDPREREAYAAALVGLTGEAQESLRVVITLRDDFLIRTQQIGPLRERLGQGLQLLGTPAAGDLERIVTEPVKRVGYAFEDTELVSEMVGAVAEQPGALALLSFTASQLWELRDRGFKRLTRSAYRALGGVGGALAQHAEATLAKMSPTEMRMTREAFRSLVTAEGTRATQSRGELLEVLGSGPEAESALERLISARLLVSEGEQEARDARVEVIHEALLSSWPRLVKWQREDAEGARMRDQLRAAARQWDQRGRARGVLWRGEALMEYRLWSARYPGALSALEREFARASLREDARGRRLRRSLLVGAFVALAAGMTVLARANSRAERNAREAQENLASMHAEQGRLSLLGGQPLQALPFLSKAYGEGIQGDWMRLMLGRALGAVPSPLASLEGHELRVMDGSFSPDGRWVATSSEDGMARLWNAATGERLEPALKHAARVFALTFSPDGKVLATGSRDRKVKLWKVPDGSLQQTFDTTAEVTQVRFSADGLHLLASLWDGTLMIWDVATGKLASTLRMFHAPVGWISLSADGARVAASGMRTFDDEEPVAFVWDVASGALVQKLQGHTRVVGAVALTPDGKRAVTGSNDGTARIWDVATGKSLAVVNASQGIVPRVAISPDASTFATAGDHNVRLWSLADGHLIATLTGHLGDITDIVFSPDGELVATASEDDTARVWDAHSGRHRITFFGHVDAVHRIQFDAASARLLSVSRDLTVKIWNAREAESRLVLAEDVQSAWFSPDERSLFSVDRSGTFRARDAETGQPVREMKLGRAANVSWSADGRSIFTDGEDAVGKAALWDAESGARRATLADAPIQAGHFRPGRKEIATSGTDGQVLLWDALDGKRIRTIGSHKGMVVGMAWRGDGQLLASGGSDAAIRLWDADAGREVKALQGQLGVILSLSFSEDGGRLVSGSSDGSARIWDVASGRLLHRLQGQGFVTTAEFDPSGRFVATGGQDGAVGIWDTENGRQLERLTLGEPVLSVRFAKHGAALLVVAKHDATLWPISIETRSPEAVAADVRCRVPYILDGNHLLPSRPQCSVKAPVASTAQQ